MLSLQLTNEDGDMPSVNLGLYLIDFGDTETAVRRLGCTDCIVCVSPVLTGRYCVHGYMTGCCCVHGYMTGRCLCLQKGDGTSSSKPNTKALYLPLSANFAKSLSTGEAAADGSNENKVKLSVCWAVLSVCWAVLSVC